MREALRAFVLHALAALAIVAGASAASHSLLAARVAGVDASTAVEQALASHATYLHDLAADLTLTSVLGSLALAVATGGVLGLGARLRRPAAIVALALASVATFVGACARVHPGLFLAPLSASHAADLLARVSPYAFAALLAASALGYLRALRARPMLAVAALVALTLALGGAAIVRPSAAEARRTPPRPHVIVLAADSMRPDHLDAAHTPHLASLLAESAYFPDTRVTQPRTGPSWVAMLTSLSPLTNGVETMFPTAAHTRLEKIALPAHLASLGYRTWLASEYVGDFLGRVSVGWDETHVPEVELREMLGQGLAARHPVALAFADTAYRLGARARSLLPERLRLLLRGTAAFSDPGALVEELADLLARERTRPIFATLFFSQPHFPYASALPHYERFASGEAPLALRYGHGPTDAPASSDAARAQVDALYRGALAETDDAVGRVLALLRDEGILDDAIVVVVSDHGEALEECAACSGHGDNLRGLETLRVPLSFRLPPGRYADGSAGTFPATPASQLDLYPTLLALLGEPPIAIHEGVALLDRAGRPAPVDPARVRFAETGEWFWPTRAVPDERIAYPTITGVGAVERGRIVIDDRWLPTIRAAKHRVAMRGPYALAYEPGRTGVRMRLYDTARDPREERDLADDEPRIAAELRDALRREVLRHPHVLPVGDYFLSRPAPVPEEYY